ncbi:hypothetical protein NUW58_g6547 [Xylaria curta]|uniref:Uncharacterized protein n=1 Tax=Xylaria curta TaxID=42375 RepID=A0ACC1NTT8_9PEZI|nr:hypothetical protein NUW58_g6547 [Xylaria curta]
MPAPLFILSSLSSTMAQQTPAFPSPAPGQAVVNLPQYPDFHPTVHVPCISDSQREMLRLLHDRPIVFLFYMIEKRAESALRPFQNQDPWIGPTIAAKLLKNKDALAMLLHSIPRAHMRAIVMGTIGWQTWSGHQPPVMLHSNPYKNNGPGTYIATICIDQRRGKGLSGNEYNTLAQMLEDYLQAYQASKLANQHRPQSAQDLLKWARGIDLIYASKRAKSGQTASIHASTVALDPNIHLAQGMSYVGCASRDITSRSSAHKQDSHFESSNYTWWLTMSCLVEMGLSPVVRVNHAIRTWEPDQLPISEILVTILSHSMVEERGFNAWPPGSMPDPGTLHDWDTDLFSVMHYRNFLQTQLAESGEAFAKRSKKLKGLEELKISTSDSQAAILLNLCQTSSASLKFADEDDVRTTLLRRGELVNKAKIADEELEVSMQFFAQITI